MSPLPPSVLPRPGCLYCEGLPGNCTCVADCGVRKGEPSQGRDSVSHGFALHTCPISTRQRHQDRNQGEHA